MSEYSQKSWLKFFATMFAYVHLCALIDFIRESFQELFGKVAGGIGGVLCEIFQEFSGAGSEHARNGLT